MIRTDGIFRPFLVLVLGFLVAFVSIHSDISSWTATLWVIDYQDEFIKRGFIGELLQAGNNSVFYKIEAINLLAKAVTYGFAIGLALFVIRFYKDNLLLGCGFLLAGFSIQQFAYDLGRFDAVNYLVTLFVVFTVSVLRTGVAVTVAIIFSLVMMLIHEASALMNIPLVFAILVFVSRQNNNTLRYPFIYLLGCIIIFLGIIVFGELDLQTFPQWEMSMHGKPVDFPIEPTALQVLSHGLHDNINMTLERLFSVSTVKRMFRVILVSIITILIMVRLYKTVAKIYSPHFALLLLLPVVSVLPMFALGIDFYRWVAALQLNYFLLAGVVLHLNKVKMEIGKGFLAVWIVFSVYSGPFGVSVALPHRNRLIENIASSMGLS